MTTALDAARLDAVIQRVADRLRGDWLLVGGALVALWLDARRVTEDVDLVGIQGTGADRLALFALAYDLGLPVEAVNSAAEYFVHRITDWRNHIELFRTGQSGRVFRPDPTLFLLLKMRRLSTRDLEDCLELLRRCRAEALAVDAPRLLTELASLAPADDSALAGRRGRLRAELEQIVG